MSYASDHVNVRVRLRNDEGEYRMEYAGGNDVDDAIRRVVAFVCEYTGDDSWTMDEWWAA